MKRLIQSGLTTVLLAAAAVSLADTAISIAPVKTLRIDRELSPEGKACITCHSIDGKPGNYVIGANIAGFLKVAKAMLAQGVI